MANWNKSITLEVIVHHTTQGLTIGKQTYQITIGMDAVWISGNGNWKAEYNLLDGHPFVIEGKCTRTTDGDFQPTTYKIKVVDNGWREIIKAKVISYS